MTSYASTYLSGNIHSRNPRALKVHHIKGILLLAGIVFCALLYKVAATPKQAPSVRLEQILYEQEQIRLQRATLYRNDALHRRDPQSEHCLFRRIAQVDGATF